MTYIAPKF